MTHIYIIHNSDIHVSEVHLFRDAENNIAIRKQKQIAFSLSQTLPGDMSSAESVAAPTVAATAVAAVFA